MKMIVIEAKDDGARLDRWMTRACPGLNQALAQKFIRQKCVRVNGAHTKTDARVAAGDEVKLFIADQYFEKPKRVDALLSKFRPHIRILYEDDQLMLIDKKPGMLVHPDGRGDEHLTLVTHVRAYLYQQGQYDSMDDRSFAPTPVNRIDRFTGGIVIVAKTRPAMQVLSREIRDGALQKHYLCATVRRPRPPRGQLIHYIEKNARRVTVHDKPASGAQRAQTNYRVLGASGALSLVECTLVTGRTHQIRAQFAHAGWPLLGDNQYGDARLNEAHGAGQQALYAYRVTFSFGGDPGVLGHLSGQTFTARDIPFVRAYFPDVTLPD